MKYIRLKTGASIIFSGNISHKEMAEAFGGKENVESAGQVSMSGILCTPPDRPAYTDLQVSTYGESLTLNIPSKKEDSNLIKWEIDSYM